jgi:hypothetical protein
MCAYDRSELATAVSSAAVGKVLVLVLVPVPVPVPVL